MKICNLLNKNQLFVLSLILVSSIMAGIAIAPRMVRISSETRLQDLYPDYSITELTKQSGAVLHCKVLSREAARWSCIDSETPNVITTDFMVEILGTNGISTGETFILRLDGGVVMNDRMTAEDNVINSIVLGKEYVLFLSAPIDETGSILYTIGSSTKVFTKYCRLMIGIDSIFESDDADTELLESLGGKYKVDKSDLENCIIEKTSGTES